MIGQALVGLTNNLAVLAQGERNNGDLGAACGEARQGTAHKKGFIIRVGVDCHHAIAG